MFSILKKISGIDVTIVAVVSLFLSKITHFTNVSWDTILCPIYALFACFIIDWFHSLKKSK